MATIKDIAKKTGYSISTVSKALNGYEDISSKAKKEIVAVAESMNYYPNYKLKNLKKKDSKSIALIINGLDENNEGSNLLYDLMAGIFRYAAEQDIEMIVYATNSTKQDQISYYQFCKNRNIDGAILMGIALDDPYFVELQESNLPIVLIDILLDKHSERMGSVTTHNVCGAFDATNFLIQMGHKEIAFMNGKKVAQVSIEREKGFRDALIENNIEFKESRLMHGDYTVEKSTNEALRLLQTDRDITAIFCASDLMAIGVYEACNKLGLKIPEDISVVGYDGLPLCKFVSPKLTTVEQDMFSMGSSAADMLREIIYQQADGKTIYIDYNLVIRDSVRKVY